MFLMENSNSFIDPALANSAFRRVLWTAEEPDQIQVVAMRLPSGTVLPLEVHQGSQEFLVLRGELQVRVLSQDCDSLDTKTLKQDYLAVVEEGERHEVTATQDTVLLTAYSPPKYEPGLVQWTQDHAGRRANPPRVGQTVRWKPSAGMDDRLGVVDAPPLGSKPPPPGGLYVLWQGLHEPMAVFEEYIEVVERPTAKPKHQTQKPRRSNPGDRQELPKFIQHAADSIARQRTEKAGRLLPTREDVSAGFAIAVSQAQKRGELYPGTMRMTRKGAARHARHSKDGPGRQEQYEDTLALVRKGPRR